MSLAALAAAWERARAGGCVALVSGEAGIGKTSLVAELAARLEGRATVAVGRCDALFTPRVLEPARGRRDQPRDQPKDVAADAPEAGGRARW